MRVSRKLYATYLPQRAAPMEGVSVDARLGEPAPEALPETTVVQPWDGEERRSGEDRRQRERRNQDGRAVLDTRSGSERRRSGRRSSDQVYLRGFVLKV